MDDITHYRIITASTADQLSRLVSEMMDMYGYQPYGHALQGQATWYQTMVKYESEEPV